MKKDMGKSYYCDWKITGGRIQAWLVAERTTRVEAADFRTAYEELWGVICMRFGDGEATLEFATDPPDGAQFQRFLQPRYVTLETNAATDFSGDFQCLFKKGVCLNCMTPTGERNTKPLVLEKRPKADKCLVRNHQTGTIIYSEDFIDLLQLQRQRVELKPVVFRSGKGPNYFEITAADALSACGVRSFEKMQVRKGFQCRKCQRRHLHYVIPKLAAHVFVARGKLPKQEVFLLDGGAGSTGFAICVRSNRWKKLRRKPGSRGIVTGLLGIVPSSEIVTNPALEKR